MRLFSAVRFQGLRRVSNYLLERQLPGVQLLYVQTLVFSELLWFLETLLLLSLLSIPLLLFLSWSTIGLLR